MLALTDADSSLTLNWHQNSWQHVLRSQLWELLHTVLWRFLQAAILLLWLLLPQQQCSLFSKELPAGLLFLRTAGNLRGATWRPLTMCWDQLHPDILFPAQAVFLQPLPRRLYWILWIWQFRFWIFWVWKLWHSLSGLWFQFLPPRLLFHQECSVILLPAWL